jgi:hypothetical protein
VAPAQETASKRSSAKVYSRIATTVLVGRSGARGADANTILAPLVAKLDKQVGELFALLNANQGATKLVEDDLPSP